MIFLVDGLLWVYTFVGSENLIKFMGFTKTRENSSPLLILYTKQKPGFHIIARIVSISSSVY